MYLWCMFLFIPCFRTRGYFHPRQFFNIFEIFLCEIANNFLSDFSRIVNFFVLMWVTFFNIQIFLGLDNKHCQMHQMLKLAGNFLLCSCSWPSNQRAKSRYVKGRSKEGQRHVRVQWLLKSHSMQIKTRNWYVAKGQADCCKNLQS